ncbi:MAG: hypothetical protein ACTSUI_00280, partial [Promethearchaeota archaeon]
NNNNNSEIKENTLPKWGFSFRDQDQNKKQVLIFLDLFLIIFISIITALFYGGSFIFCIIQYTFILVMLDPSLYIIFGLMNRSALPIKNFIGNYKMQKFILKRTKRFNFFHLVLIFIIEMCLTVWVHFSLSILKTDPNYNYIPQNYMIWIILISIEVFLLLILWLIPNVIIRLCYKVKISTINPKEGHFQIDKDDKTWVYIFLASFLILLLLIPIGNYARNSESSIWILFSSILLLVICILLWQYGYKWVKNHNEYPVSFEEKNSIEKDNAKIKPKDNKDTNVEGLKLKQVVRRLVILNLLLILVFLILYLLTGNKNLVLIIEILILVYLPSMYILLKKKNKE